jgi:uncharacterized protein YceK
MKFISKALIISLLPISLAISGCGTVSTNERQKQKVRVIYKQTVRIIYKHSDGNVFERSEVIVYRKDLSWIAQLKTNGKVSKVVTLKEGYVPIIPLFVKELEALPKEKKCSIVDSYVVYIDGRVIRRVDGTCEWNGFLRLKYAFFEESK